MALYRLALKLCFLPLPSESWDSNHLPLHLNILASCNWLSYFIIEIKYDYTLFAWLCKPFSVVSLLWLKYLETHGQFITDDDDGYGGFLLIYLYLPALWVFMHATITCSLFSLHIFNTGGSIYHIIFNIVCTFLFSFQPGPILSSMQYLLVDITAKQPHTTTD